jgi:DNA-directed RNA polymerase sigma subunit (sigma70/sigma32)
MYEDFIALFDEDDGSYQKNLRATEASYQVNKLFASDIITKKEIKVLSFRYLDGMTLEECSKILDETGERVGQIEAKAKFKINYYFKFLKQYH